MFSTGAVLIENSENNMHQLFDYSVMDTAFEGLHDARVKCAFSFNHIPEEK